MRRIAALLLLPCLAACAAPQDMTPGATVAPRTALLYTDAFNVIMSDRTLCVGERPGRAAQWQGRLAGCPHLWDYRVNRVPATPRTVLAPSDQRIAAEIRAPDGRCWGYAAP